MHLRLHRMQRLLQRLLHELLRLQLSVEACNLLCELTLLARRLGSFILETIKYRPSVLKPPRLSALHALRAVATRTPRLAATCGAQYRSRSSLVRAAAPGSAARAWSSARKSWLCFCRRSHSASRDSASSDARSEPASLCASSSAIDDSPPGFLGGRCPDIMSEHGALCLSSSVFICA